ncbi:hypothetical protein PHMEG_00024217 [Phytophthora megakarya]|uniref:Uncharacterized protein n=1 Tax=Phytophthora megakarya TaxID=4795 RepID=A0A225VF16_9STRA|nr:hypothetical protein PHMEG_00024217 [Phytophthora megakarya]
MSAGHRKALVVSTEPTGKHRSSSVLWLKLNFTIKTARLQSLKRQKYQHLQEEALLKARGLLQNWEDGPICTAELEVNTKLKKYLTTHLKHLHFGSVSEIILMLLMPSNSFGQSSYLEMKWVVLTKRVMLHYFVALDVVLTLMQLNDVFVVWRKQFKKTGIETAKANH